VNCKSDLHRSFDAAAFSFRRPLFLSRAIIRPARSPRAREPSNLSGHAPPSPRKADGLPFTRGPRTSLNTLFQQYPAVARWQSTAAKCNRIVVIVVGG